MSDVRPSIRTLKKDPMIYYLIKNYAGNVQPSMTKLTKPPESLQDQLASDDDFLLYQSPEKKLNLTLKGIGVSPVNIHGVAHHSRASNVN